MAKTTTTPAAQTKAPVQTKMARARLLYAEVTRKAAPEGKTHRGIFMERADELGLSAKAANTYFQNIKTELDVPAQSTATGLKADLKELRTMATELNDRLNKMAKKVA